MVNIEKIQQKYAMDASLTELRNTNMSKFSQFANKESLRKNKIRNKDIHNEGNAKNQALKKAIELAESAKKSLDRIWPVKILNNEITNSAVKISADIGKLLKALNYSSSVNKNLSGSKFSEMMNK